MTMMRSFFVALLSLSSLAELGQCFVSKPITSNHHALTSLSMANQNKDGTNSAAAVLAAARAVRAVHLPRPHDLRRAQR